MSNTRVLLLPARADLPARLAQSLLARHRAALPDLTGLTLLVATPNLAPPLRRQLGVQAGGALLGPRVLGLQQFAAARGQAPAPVPAAECRLILVEALRKYRGLFPGQNPWQLAEALFALFEELNLNGVSLPDDADAFASRLAGAYGARPLAALSREAQIVHTLWRAFQDETGGRSPASAYAQGLRSACASLRADEAVYLAGFDQLAGCERAALSQARAPLEFWLHGRAAGRDGAATVALCAQLGVEPEVLEADGDARSRFLDAALSGAPAPGEHPELSITAAESPEHEARCVDLAVREFLLGGCAGVAVVTEDRRLARRLRALLERAGIELQDLGGWALSTSAAAAALHAWLDTAERRFQFRPLLALLKSGFFEADPQAVRALERDLVYRQGVESGLEHYRAAARRHPQLLALLERLEQAARGLPATNRPRPLRDWMAGIERSLKSLGLWQRFGEDEAGRRLLEMLGELDAAFAQRPQSADWREFRALLDRAAERATFVPPQSGRDRRVRLLTLEQAAGLRCDALVLAGATRGQIPGPPPGEPFFNQSVRGELGLPTLAQRHALWLNRLRRVLEAAPRLRITYGAEQAGEPAQLSPWIEALESHAASLGLDLRDRQLAARAGSAGVEISTPAGARALRRKRPAPPTPAARLPLEISATAHQRLVDCPYQFYVNACLGLRAEQAPDEDPDRSDYGERVHRILEAFTQRTRDAALPPPFEDPVTPANRAEAQSRLQEIAAAVFAPDLNSRALAHVWVTEFQGALPLLLDWLERRQPAQVAAEVKKTCEFTAGRFLGGTADRVETLADGSLTLVDYKTGRTPRRGEIESGEAVQLVHYALLDGNIGAVEYLPLRDGEKPLRIDDELDALRANVGGRLARDLQRMAQGAPLPALGDSATCAWCDFHGVCRRGDWHD